MSLLSPTHIYISNYNGPFVSLSQEGQTALDLALRRDLPFLNTQAIRDVLREAKCSVEAARSNLRNDDAAAAVAGEDD
jgi:hypothetical protein